MDIKIKKISIIVGIVILAVFIFLISSDGRYIMKQIFYSFFPAIKTNEPILNANLLEREETIFFEKNNSLFSIKSNGVGEKELYKNVNGNVSGYSLSPDGKKMSIATYKPETLIFIDLDTNKKVIVESAPEGFVRGIGSVEWSPDSTKLAYISSTSNGQILFAYNLIDGNKTSLKKPDSLSHIDGIKWRKDGNLILYNNWCKDTKTDCYIIYDPNINQYFRSKYDASNQNWYDVIGFDNIHFNQYYGNGTSAEWLSPNKKYRLIEDSEDNCSLYLATVTSTDENLIALKKTCGMGYVNLPIERKEILIKTPLCPVTTVGSTPPNFRGVSWFSDSKFVLVSYRRKETYIINVDNKKIYKLSDVDSYLGPPLIYIPDYKPTVPLCFLK